jgi:hypothetical protein
MSVKIMSSNAPMVNVSTETNFATVMSTASTLLMKISRTVVKITNSHSTPKSFAPVTATPLLLRASQPALRVNSHAVMVLASQMPSSVTVKPNARTPEMKS